MEPNTDHLLNDQMASTRLRLYFSKQSWFSFTNTLTWHACFFFLFFFFSGKRPFLERLRAQEEKDEVMQALEEYRKPRDALLILVSDFIRICAPRLEELETASLPPRYTVPELLQNISINVRLKMICFIFTSY